MGPVLDPRSFAFRRAFTFFLNIFFYKIASHIRIKFHLSLMGLHFFVKTLDILLFLIIMLSIWAT